MSDHTRADEGEGREPTFPTDEATRALIADLERELGAKGTADVFRKALAIAREASQTGEHSGFSGAGIRSVIGSRKDIDLVQRWCQQVGTIPYLQERIKATEAEVARLTAAVKLLLPFMDYAAGEGLALVPSPDEPEMDAADICTAVAKALNIELGGSDYMAFAARAALEAPHDDN